MNRPWNGDWAVTNQPLAYHSGRTLPTGTRLKLSHCCPDSLGVLRWRAIDEQGVSWTGIPDTHLSLAEPRP